MQLYWNEHSLPWTRTEADNRFRRILFITLAVSTLLAVSIALLPEPETKRQTLEQISPHLAKLILEKRQEQKTKKAKPKPKADRKLLARKKAKRSGLVAMSRELESLQKSFDLDSLLASPPLQSGGSTKKSKKANLLDAAKQTSTGIDTKNLSNETGSQELATRETTSVQSTIERKQQTQRRSSSNTRPEEEIELVFQKNKGTIFSLYNRALRRDPTLQGKVVLELTIDANGRVVKCRILSSELNNSSLERKLVARVKLFRFPSRKVKQVTVTYPIDFLPS